MTVCIMDLVPQGDCSTREDAVMLGVGLCNSGFMHHGWFSFIPTDMGFLNVSVSLSHLSSIYTRELSLLFLCCMFTGSYVLLVTDLVLPFLHVYITFKKQSSGQRLENLRATVSEWLWPSMLSVNSIRAPP